MYQQTSLNFRLDIPYVINMPENVFSWNKITSIFSNSYVTDTAEKFHLMNQERQLNVWYSPKSKQPIATSTVSSRYTLV